MLQCHLRGVRASIKAFGPARTAFYASPPVALHRHRSLYNSASHSSATTNVSDMKLAAAAVSAVSNTPASSSSVSASVHQSSSVARDAPATLLSPSARAQPQFLKHLSNYELFCFAIMSVMTTPAILPLAIKMMPYVPNVLIKHLVYPIYCGGETFGEVVKTGSRLVQRGYGNMMISYSVENAEGSAAGASHSIQDAVPQILGSIDQILVQHALNVDKLHEQGQTNVMPTAGYVALKPTGLMSEAADILRNFDQPEYADKWQAYLDVCRTICRYALEQGQGRAVVVFDAEKYVIQQGVYAAQRAMMREFNRDGQVVVVGTLQMYLQDSVAQLETELRLAAQDNYQLGMKLVRGAYVHSEPDRWNTVHKTKSDTDASYNQGVALMMDSIVTGWQDAARGIKSLPAVGRLVVASHNEHSMALVDERMRNDAPLGLDLARDESVVFGQLLGMADDQGLELSRRGRKVVKYVPWGPVADTKAYLTRRLEENGDAVREGGWRYLVLAVSEFGRRLFI